MPSPVKKFSELKKNLKKDSSLFPKVNIAVLGDSSTQFFVHAIRGYSCEVCMDFNVYEADYDQVEMQILDSSSEFYKFKPDVVIVFLSVHKLLKKYAAKSYELKQNFSDSVIENITNLVETINRHQKCKIIFFNFPEIIDSVFGNYSNKLNFSFIYNLRKINIALMDMIRKIKNLY